MTLLDRLRAMPPGSLVPVAWIVTELEASPPAPAAPVHTSANGVPAMEDRLLTITEAATRLSVTEDWLYHHAKRLPFAVKLGGRTLRFSAAKLERYLEARRRGTVAP